MCSALHCVYCNYYSVPLDMDRAQFLSEEVRLAAQTDRGPWNIKSHTVDAILMHHEIYNSTREERGVQKNIKIQYLKGGTEFYLKSGALFKHHAYYFVVCLYLLPLTDPSLPCVVMRAGICCDPIDWLTLEFPFFLFEEIPHPHVYSRQRKSGSVQRICHLPPWPPGAMVISIQVNITGSRFPIMFPHTASCCSGSQP